MNYSPPRASFRGTARTVIHALGATSLAACACVATASTAHAQVRASFSDSQLVQQSPVRVAGRFALGEPSQQVTPAQLPTAALGMNGSVINAFAFDDQKKLRAPWTAPLASLVVPGAGQAMLGQQRSVAYAFTDAYVLLVALRALRDANRQRDEYRNIASTVARNGATAVGTWDYYEAMEKRSSSGAFDRVAGGAVDPETDITTFNGDIWRIARLTYWTFPDSTPPLNSAEYVQSLAWYKANAITPEFFWNWRDAGTSLDLFRSTIVAANRSKKRTTNLLGIAAANHLISMIDAYVTVRVRRYGGAGIGAHVGARAVPNGTRDGIELVPTVSGQLPIPRLRK